MGEWRVEIVGAYEGSQAEDVGGVFDLRVEEEFEVIGSGVVVWCSYEIWADAVRDFVESWAWFDTSKGVGMVVTDGEWCACTKDLQWGLSRRGRSG